MINQRLKFIKLQSLVVEYFLIWLSFYSNLKIDLNPIKINDQHLTDQEINIL